MCNALCSLINFLIRKDMDKIKYILQFFCSSILNFNYRKMVYFLEFSAKVQNKVTKNFLIL